ncbi:hypothetical protein [Limobrevibacterium gyesilva]|nr:hypothetical protein [Limobrevibacterium gyesilva]
MNPGRVAHAGGQAGSAPAPGLLAALGLAGSGPDKAAERHLLEAAHRLPQEWAALVLHLSRLQQPAPRPHHRRVARALLQEAAQRHDGQVLALRNGDLVLLYRAHMLRAGAAGTPLAVTLAQLLQAVAPDPAAVISVWPLGEARDQLLGYAAERLIEPSPGGWHDSDAVADPESIDRLALLAEGGRLTDLLHRQTAVLLGQSRARPGNALRPIYREVSVSLAALEARTGAGPVDADPFLFRHLAGRLDQHMLAALRQEIGGAGALDAATAPRLQVNLTLSGILSGGFEKLAAATVRAGATLGVEVALAEAGADLVAFARARNRLAAAGMELVLDGVSHLALLLTCPEALGAGLVKLDWSPRMARLAPGEQQELTAAVSRLGVQRIVLNHAETETAVQWGIAQGIRRFQGRHVDAMLGVGRIVACPASHACTLRQCIERGAAAAPAGRAGCTVPALLDAAAPPEPVP